MILRDWLRPREKPAAASKAATPAAQAKPPAPSIATEGRSLTIVLVTVLGLSDDALAKVIEIATAECRRTGTRPLFVTDGSDFSLFRRQRLLFEQVVDPAVCDASEQKRDWQAYARQQFRLIGQKWHPATTVAFGRKPHPSYLEAILLGSRKSL